MSRTSPNSNRISGLVRILLLLAAAAPLLLGFAGGARADYSLTLTSGVNSNPSYGGVYVGPYPVSVNGTTTGLICDDYSTEIGAGKSWSANLYGWSDRTSFKFYNETSFGNHAANADDAYKQVFWLAGQMVNPANQGSVAAIHFAIWQIFDPSTPAGPAGTQTWLDNATRYAGSVDTSLYQVYTPDPFSASQEFIKVGSPVPIPPSLLLLSTGLIGVTALRKRVRRQPKQAARRGEPQPKVPEAGQATTGYDSAKAQIG